MNEAAKKGLGFGVSSAIITTLGLVVGLHSGTNLKEAVIGAILVIAFADSMADGLGIYFSERAREGCKKYEPWISFVSAFLSKFVFALTFTLPILLIANLHTAIIVDIVYGLILLIIFSYIDARSKKEDAVRMIIFHVLLAAVVVTASHYIGTWIGKVL